MSLNCLNILRVISRIKKGKSYNSDKKSIFQILRFVMILVLTSKIPSLIDFGKVQCLSGVK